MEENLFESLFIIINDKVTNINELNCFACFSHAPLIYQIHFYKSILFLNFFTFFYLPLYMEENVNFYYISMD